MFQDFEPSGPPDWTTGWRFLLVAAFVGSVMVFVLRWWSLLGIPVLRMAWGYFQDDGS